MWAVCIFLAMFSTILHYTLRFNKVEIGYTGFTLSICPSVDRMVSAQYLQQYLPDPFHIYASYQATSEGVWYARFIVKFKKLKFWQIFKFVTLTLDPTWINTMGNHGGGYPQNAGVLVVLVYSADEGNFMAHHDVFLFIYYLFHIQHP